MKQFSLPTGWNVRLFEQCISKVKYTDKQPTKSFLEEGLFPVISQEKEFINGYSNNKDAVFTVKKPVVIFGDHTKNVKYVDFDFVIGADGVKILQPIQEIDSKYFYYYLCNIRLRDLGYARHYKLLKECVVCYPSLPEQKRIVEKLDKIFADIDKAKENTTKNLQNAKEVFESCTDTIFAEHLIKWPEKTLNDVCIVERGSSPRPIKSFITTASDGVNWIKIGDCSGKYVTSTTQKITPEGAKKSRYVRRGDFIISNSMSYGKPYIMDIDGYIHDGWFVLRLNHDILVTDFLYYLLSSPFAKHQYDTLAAGAIVQNISSDLIKKVKFNLPSIAEQRKIVAQLDALRTKTQELEQIYTKKLADLDELKQSVLQQAFSGKL